jgi:hypothetical protein
MKYSSHALPVCGQFYQHSPSFFMNSMGFGLCDDVASVLAFLWEEMGYKVRTWDLHGHVVSEVYANNEWLLYDADLCVVYYKKNKRVAGVEYLQEHPELISMPVNKNMISSKLGAYSENVKNIYLTKYNNHLTPKIIWKKFKTKNKMGETVIDKSANRYTPKLEIKLPAKATFAIGRIFNDKRLKIRSTQTSKSNTGENKPAEEQIGQARLTIPAHSNTTLNIPLFIHSIQGDSNDKIRVQGFRYYAHTKNVNNKTTVQYVKTQINKEYNINSKDLKQFLNDRVKANPGSLLTNPVEITIKNNNKPIHIIYLVNPAYTKLTNRNIINLKGENIDSLNASLLSVYNEDKTSDNSIVTDKNIYTKSDDEIGITINYNESLTETSWVGLFKEGTMKSDNGIAEYNKNDILANIYLRNQRNVNLPVKLNAGVYDVVFFIEYPIAGWLTKTCKTEMHIK